VRDRLKKYAHDLRTLPADAAVAWRLEGWRGVRDALAPRTLHRVFRRGRLVVYAQPVTGARDVPPPPGVRLAPLGRADWPALASLVTGRELERFRVLIGRGHSCILAWRGERPIGYAWVARRMDADVSQCPLPLPEHAAYLWDLYVAPDERSSGIGSALASARLRIAREAGCREGWRMIERTNGASLRTLSKSGDSTRVVGEMRYLKLLTWMHARFAPAAGGSGG